MRTLFFMLGCWLFSLTGNAQEIYRTPIGQPEQYVRNLTQTLSTYRQQIACRAETIPVAFSDNETFYLAQIVAQAQMGQTYYLNMVLSREPAFAKKLHQALDTIWLRETALNIRNLNARQMTWQQAMAGTPLPLPTTFLAEAEQINVQPGEDVLEIGVGDGAFSLALQRQEPAATYWLNELDTALLDLLAVRLRQEYSGAAIRLVRGQTDRTEMPAQSADKVILRQVLHHLEQPGALLQDIRQTLRTQGQLFLLEGYAESCAMCCSDSWTQARIQATLQQHGFQQVEEYPVPQSSFYLTVWEVRPR